MNSNKKWQHICLAFAVAFTLNLSAQVQSQVAVTTGPSMTEVKVDRATVMLVDGNDLVVKTEDGRLVHFANVSESARATVDGQQLGIHDLKPGMILERTITTTTTPQLITTVKSVTGTVWNVNPPDSVILTLEDGTNQAFKIPSGQKFNIDGEMVDAFGLRKGMKVTATKIVEEPQDMVEQHKEITGTNPLPPDPPADGPLLVVLVLAPDPAPADSAAPAQAPAAAPAPDPPAALPKTASPLPLVGLIGGFAVLLGAGLRGLRMRA